MQYHWCEINTTIIFKMLSFHIMTSHLWKGITVGIKDSEETWGKGKERPRGRLWGGEVTDGNRRGQHKWPAEK